MTDMKNAARLASVAIAGLVVGGAATLGLNANAETATPSAPASSSTQQGSGQQDQQGQQDERGGRGHGPRMGTEVTGDELAKVSAAVKAKDSSFTVEHVMKDDQGAYHVMGTKDGNRSGYEVSKDLKTITAHTMGERGGKGGPGGHQHTAASTSEKTKVTEAVKAKDSTVTVTDVMKDADGSYDARGTKDGKPVMVEVSKDLKTIEVRTGGPGEGKGGPGGHQHTAASASEKTKVTEAVKAKDSTVTVTDVMKDADGSYDVHGTKDGDKVMVEVSKDLKTIEVRTGGPGPR